MFKRKKKEVKYQTNISIGDIFHIKSPEPASVFVVGSDVPDDYITITVTTGATLYTLKLKTEEKEV